MKLRPKKIFNTAFALLIIPALLIAAVVLGFYERYNVLSIVIAVTALVPFFLAYERRAPKIEEIVIIAVMTALAVGSRILFYPVPGFKPVTAIIVITAVGFGREAGFLTGALSALLSNIYFGQGPWTPFQMFAWGITGFFAGLLAEHKCMKKWWELVIYGVFAGVLFSLLMDIWTAISLEGTFSFTRYGAVIMTSFVFMGLYVASNVVFLLVLGRPVLKIFERIKLKYGIIADSNE